MNVQADRYTILKTLYSKQQTEFFLAIRNKDQKKVVLKCLLFTAAPSDNQLQTEFSILQQLDHPSIINSLTFESLNGKPTLVSDYFEGTPLNEYLSSKPLTLLAFLPIAIKLAKAISTVHHAGVIHCNISPSNILFQPQQQSLLITGFSRALIKQQSNSKSLTTLPLDNLNYIAPEQSGRTNQLIDYRTDIYSLGILFFQMLSGYCPFEAKDSIGLMHNHIAKTAPLLSDINPHLPSVIVRIIDKMISKNPDDRYQNLVSLIADLQMSQLAHSSKQGLFDFDIGKTNNSGQLFNSGKLYGREQQITQLQQSYDKTCKGATILTLLKGPSGVGKSSLVQAVKQHRQKCIGGYCITAKYDQYNHNAPFAMLYSAFRNLIKTLLSESDNVVSIWRKKLLLALADNGQLLIDAVPEAEILIGPQPKVQQIPPAEAKIRLNSLLNKFIQVLCLPEQPLCIFLDDLQWADQATLHWLETVSFDVSHLMIIVAYRDNEVTKNHYLAVSLKKITNQGACIDNITLESLPSSVISEMVADNMNIATHQSTHLAKAVYDKTQGNPFFVIQYFQQLQKEGILWFDLAAYCWEYDIDKIQNSQISDNVVAFLSNRITLLSEPFQQVLKIAACIGNQFDKSIIQAITNLNTKELTRYFDLALNDGWIINFTSPDKNNNGPFYTFSHDRIQQAAWSLLSNQQLQQINLQIGRYVLEHKAHDDEFLLQTANYLNTARPLITSKDEKSRLGALNFKAGLTAKQSGDFELALSYIKIAMEIFADSLNDKAINATLIRERAECEHLCGNNSQAKIFYEQAVLEATSIIEKSYLYELMIQFYTDLAQFDEAYRVSRLALQMFDIKLPSHFNSLLFATDFIKLKFQLRTFEISKLVDLPKATDAKTNIIIRLLSATLKVAYQIKPELCVAISVKLVRLSLQHGNTAEAVVGYMVFGVIFLGGVLGNHQAGYEYGKLSLALLDKYDNDRQRAEVNFVYGYFANSWTHPAKDTEQYWNTAYLTGLRTGDWFHTSCACSGIIQSLFMRGIPLDQIWEESERFSGTLQRIGSQEQLGAISTVRQAILNLQGKTDTPACFNDSSFNESTFVESLKDYGSRHFAHFYFINKMQCLYLQGHYQQAFEMSQYSAEYLKDSTGMLHSVDHYFYTALTLSMLFPQGSRLQRHRWLKQLKWTEKKLTHWAKRCSENFTSRLYLISGEIHRLQGSELKALNCYEKASQAAEVHEQLHIQALVNDLAAHLYHSMGQPRLVNFHREQATYFKQRWGVSSSHQSVSIEQNTQKTTINDPTNKNHLDVATLIKSAVVIAEQRRLPDLLKTSLAIVIENAGAQRGILLLNELTGLVIQAESSLGAADISVLQNIDLYDYSAIPHSIINFVFRTQESVVLDNTLNNSIYSQDNDVINRKVLSVLCAPLIVHGKIKGIIYLENNATTNAFSEKRLTLLQHLSGQICISIDNAQVYQNLETKVIERTKDIEIQKAVLAENNRKLKKQNDTISLLNTQLQIENEERCKTEKELYKVNAKLHTLSITDALTQISNRRHFDNYLQQECDRLNRDSSLPLALFLCDIDYFKSYNDFYGHQAGDECLIRVAQALAKALKRPADLVARYGGEEFAVILPHTEVTGVDLIAKNIHQQLAALQIPHLASKVKKQLTISIGIAISHPQQYYSPEQFIKKADEALYEAKENGRNGSICKQLI